MYFISEKDLRENFLESVSDLFKFILGIKKFENTILETRIKNLDKSQIIT